MEHKVGILSISDRRERVHQGLAPVLVEHATKLAQALEATGQVEPITCEPIHSPEEARRTAQALLEAQVDGIIFNCAVFGFPHLAMIAAQLIRRPILVYAPREERFPALTGLLDIAGGFANVGIPHARVWGAIDDPKIFAQVMAFVRAATAVQRLRGQVYGLFGGRSMGLYTATPSGTEWLRRFGVDMDHVDQYEIVRRAESVSSARVARGVDWLQHKAKNFQWDPVQLTPQKLDLQVRSYLATKDLVAEYQFDFIGVKCHYEISEHFVTQCLTAAFMNDPYDWEGPKEPVAMSCEADGDAALTMQILKLVSGGPPSLLDIRFYDEARQVYVMNNCGAAPTSFAALSDSPDENLAHCDIVPVVPKYAGGGAHVRFVFKEGPYTVARLQRENDEYSLLISRAEAVNLPLTEVTGVNPAWPHAFLRMNVTTDALIHQLDSNHVHIVPGDYVEELKLVSQFTGIKTRILNA